MAVSEDLMQAKQILSARLLSPGLQGGVITPGFTPILAAAVASAGNNVHAVGVGKKVVNGKVTRTRAVRIYVTQKIAKSLLPKSARLPETIEGFPTDIIESPRAFFAAACSTNKQQRQRPIVGGISIAHKDVTAGTLGYFCRSVRAGDDPEKIYVLSNNHVLANTNNGQIGDNIFQPSPQDGGMAVANRAARLHRFITLNMDGQAANNVDAAIAEVNQNVDITRTICEIGRITGTRQGEEDMEVRKHGRTTGLTEGIITDESINTTIQMSHTNPNILALFINQMRIEPIAPHGAIGLGGDSGSLVVHRETREAVGLYFANPPGGSYGLANRIENVINELEIQLL
jgi:hypothetical protein